MAIPLGSNFSISTNLPIDDRMVVKTIAERNAIPANRRYVSMEVYVLNEDKNYQLRGGIENNRWVNANTLDPSEINAYNIQQVDDLIAIKLTDKAYVDKHIADSVKHITPAERTAWNSKLDKTGNATQDMLLKTLTVHGNILPGGKNLNIGSPTQRFKGIYVDEAYLSTNTLYIGDIPIIGAEANTVNIKPNPDQNIAMKTSATGTTTVTSEKAVNITTSGINSAVTVQATGVNSQANFAATAAVNVNAPRINLSGETNIKGNLIANNLSVTGNFTVGGTLTAVNATNLEIADNLIEINKGEKGQGVAEGIAGIKIDRGVLNDVAFVFDETDDKFKVGDMANLLPLATEKYVYDNRYIHPGSGTNPHGTTKANVGLDNVTNESKATMFTSPSFTGVPVAPTAAAGTNTTQLATTAFVKTGLDTKANASHGNHVPALESVNARKFLRNDNTWQLLPNATTAGSGLVKLNDSTSSNSTVEAATANALRVTYELAASKATTAVATAIKDGLMSKTDKSKLDGVAANANNYVHPTTHPASIIVETSNKRFVTDADIAKWNTKADTGEMSSTYLKLSGGTLTGNLTVQQNNLRIMTANSWGSWERGMRLVNGDSTEMAKVTFGGVNGLTADYVSIGFSESNKLSLTKTDISFNGHKIYHAGNKPTAADINAAVASHTHSNYAVTTHTHSNYSLTTHAHSNYSLTSHTHDFANNHNHDKLYLKLTGGTVDGKLTILGTAASESFKTRGIQGVSQTGTINDALYLNYNTTFPVYINGDNRAYHEGFKPSPADIGAAAAHDHPYLPLTGGTMTGGITTPADRVWTNSGFGINMRNSDMIGVSRIYFNDKSTSQYEGLLFLKAGKAVGSKVNTDYDSVRSYQSVLYYNTNKIYHQGFKPTPADIGAAATSHGNHVPTLQTANKAVFLRNDNTWQTVTPDNIGAAATSHTHSYLPLSGGSLSGNLVMNAAAKIQLGTSALTSIGIENTYKIAIKSVSDIILCADVDLANPGVEYVQVASGASAGLKVYSNRIEANEKIVAKKQIDMGSRSQAGIKYNEETECIEFYFV